MNLYSRRKRNRLEPEMSQHIAALEAKPLTVMQQAAELAHRDRIIARQAEQLEVRRQLVDSLANQARSEKQRARDLSSQLSAARSAVAYALEVLQSGEKVQQAVRFLKRMK